MLNKQHKKCVRCKNDVSDRNKTGFCHPCSKSNKWYSGLTINNLVFIKFNNKDNGYERWTINCFCGNIFTTRASSIKLGKVRSCGCLNKKHCKILGVKQKGCNSPVWISDRSKTSVFLRGKDFLRNKGGSWQYLSRKYKKDKNYTCELSGEKLTKPYQLAVHHIESITLRPDLILDTNNLVCISALIHREFHKLYGKKTNKKQWEEFIILRCYNTAPTLKGAIGKYHSFIKGTA